MDANEAHDYAMKVVEGMMELGVEVTIKPCKAKVKEDKELLAKYSGPERASPEKWCHVSLKGTSAEHGDLIFQKARELNRLGIGFDTGGMVGGCGRDWEFDWSFHLGEHSEDLDIARDAVEELSQLDIDGVMALINKSK